MMKRGNSMASMPRSIRLYVFIGSAAVNGGLPINNHTLFYTHCTYATSRHQTIQIRHSEGLSFRHADKNFLHDNETVLIEC